MAMDDPPLLVSLNKIISFWVKTQIGHSVWDRIVSQE